MSVSTTDKAHQLREYGMNTAAQLRTSTANLTPDERKEILALSERLKFCNAPKNTWLGTELHSEETGELYEGFGRYWHCSSKLCSYCLRMNAKRNRSTLRAAIADQRPRPDLSDDELKAKFPHLVGKRGLGTGEHYRFITLTIPNPGIDIAATREIVRYAWSLLRKRSWFVRSVVGGAKAEEFTVTPKGFHYHLHLLTRSKNIRGNDLRYEWTTAVRKAFADNHLPFEVDTKDGMLFANIKIVHDLKQVSNEVCKYITKADSWLKMPSESLAQIALIPHWHRMFEVFGSFRNIKPKNFSDRTRDVSDELFPQTFDELDYPEEKARNYWRTLLKTMTLDKYLRRLKAEYEDTLIRRHYVLQLKFRWATITPLNST